MRRNILAMLVALAAATLLLACDGGDDDGELGDACEVNADCEADLFCETPVGQCDEPGTCEVRPGPCPAVEQPVCGCDDVTYSNSCIAASFGVSVRSAEPCP